MSEDHVGHVGEVPALAASSPSRSRGSGPAAPASVPSRSREAKSPGARFPNAIPVEMLPQETEPQDTGSGERDPEDQLNRAFMALADPLRRKILARLARGDATVNQLAEPFTVTIQAISKHLQVLEGAGLITRSRDAQRRPCHLNTPALGPLADWIENYRQMAEERFQRLDALLEEGEA